LDKVRAHYEDLKVGHRLDSAGAEKETPQTTVAKAENANSDTTLKEVILSKRCRVFISYSHDSPEHRQRVLALAERLRKDGVDAQLDRYVAGTPKEGWPRWMLDKLDWADFVLVVCTEAYYKRFRGHGEPDKGKGGDWEGNLITSEIYNNKSKTAKFVPIFFDSKDGRFIPEPLRDNTTHYLLDSEDNYAGLYAFLTGQAGVTPGELGPLKTLAREVVQSLTFAVPGEETPPAGKLDQLPGDEPQKTGSDALEGSQSVSAGDSLTIRDNRLRDPHPPILEIIPYKETPTVDKLLDRIWNSLKSPPKVPDPHTYGREWILYDPKGEYFHNIGTRWAQFIENKQLDERPLREVGINPGMTLEVQRAKQARIIVNPRPFLGAGAEILVFVYKELRDVAGFLNKIQDSIPELSAENYGTKWVLYNPERGRTPKIVKGDSRALRTAEIATEEDGDAFLYVQPPRQIEQASVWRWWTELKPELKAAVIAGSFAIVVAVVTGIFNLRVASYNGAKVSPTPMPVQASTRNTEIMNASIFVEDIPFHPENTHELAIPNYKGELKWQAHGELEIDERHDLILRVDSTIEFKADKKMTPDGMEVQPGWAIRETQEIPVHFNGGEPDIVSFENGSTKPNSFAQIRQTMTTFFPSPPVITESVFPDSFVQDCHPVLPGPPLLLHITFKPLPLRVVKH
jgi:hypothetical protein